MVRDVSVFKFNGESEVRSVMIDNEPWFVLSDVCRVLDLSNTTVVASRIDEDDRAKFDLGRQGEATIVNESGLYGVILRSDKPEAKPFKRWVTSEVLPSIRKTGGYLSPTVDFSNPEVMMKLLNNWAEDRKKLEYANAVIEESKPKVEFYDAVTGSTDTIDMSQVAKVLNAGIGRNKLFELLRNKGVLMGNNEPMQSYVDRGWFRQIECKFTRNSDTRIYIKTVVFQKGVEGIRKMIESSK